MGHLNNLQQIDTPSFLGPILQARRENREQQPYESSFQISMLKFEKNL